MTKQELDTLYELLEKLQKERLDELNKEYPEVYSERLEKDVDVYTLLEEDPMSLYELDDGDRLSEGLDIVITVVAELKGTN